jgi:hypothetical protein
MPATYEPIATTTLATSATGITFTSIPSTYTDLRVVWVGRLTAGGGGLRMNFNSNSSNIFSYTSLRGDGSTAASERSTNNSQAFINYNLGAQPSFVAVDIFSYANTSVFKTMLATAAEDFNGSGTINNNVLLFRNTSAINRIDLATLFGDLFVAGTTATLYGILKA